MTSTPTASYIRPKQGLEGFRGDRRADRVAHRSPIRHPPEGEPAIVIRLAEQTPADYLPGVLAFARVYEGVHITVFWDRIERQPRFAPPVVVLAHVLVHEITHILQTVNRHSESGVMKSRWTAEDHREMASKPLQFTPLDVELIQHGLDSRSDARARPPRMRF
jgi:hypothetical protein